MIENDFRQLNFSVIGKDSSLEGDFKFSGDTLVNCQVNGTLTMIDESKLVLERSSQVEGEIYCHDLEVFGRFSGTINASGTLSIRSSASISGRINANKMSIFPGAQINMEGHTQSEDAKQV